jgi:hypothetical protein
MISGMAPRKGRSRGRGRPSAGVRAGEKVSDYKRFTIRLPDDSLAALDAIARVTKVPAWRVMVDALAAYHGERPVLSEGDRRLVRGVLRRSSE